MKLLKVGLLATLIAGSFFAVSTPSANAERYWVNTVPAPGYYFNRGWGDRRFIHRDFRRVYVGNDYWRWHRYPAYRRRGGWY